MSSNRAGEEDRPQAATLKLIVAYDGSGFVGAQAQAHGRTVQAELEAAFAPLFGAAPRVVLAGRTDGGVHAAGQVVGVPDRRPELSDETLRRALNAALADDLAVLSVERVDGAFHARYDARWREYRYRLWSGVRQPLARGQVWRVAVPVSLDAMAEASGLLVGEHDLAAFAGGGEGVPWSERRTRPRGTVRRVTISSAREMAPWWGDAGSGKLVEYRVVADGFLPRMVRTIVGTLVEIGRGDRPVGWIEELLAGRDRRQAGQSAPAHGLTLWRVGYGDDEPDPPG